MGRDFIVSAQVVSCFAHVAVKKRTVTDTHMNKPETQTQTTDRIDATTDTTTGACPVCEQTVSAGEFVTLGVGADRERTAICRYCADSLLGFEGEPDGLGPEMTGSGHTIAARQRPLVRRPAWAPSTTTRIESDADRDLRTRLSDAVPEPIKWVAASLAITVAALAVFVAIIGAFFTAGDVLAAATGIQSDGATFALLVIGGATAILSAAFRAANA